MLSNVVSYGRRLILTSEELLREVLMYIEEDSEDDDLPTIVENVHDMISEHLQEEDFAGALH